MGARAIASAAEQEYLIYNRQVTPTMRCLHPLNLGNGAIMPCGKCEPCLKRYSLEWQDRIMDEYKLTNLGLFYTFTYDPEHCPDDMQLRKVDMQLFFKRLRKAIAPQRIRYYMSGEYGGKNNRPHYHAVIFGWEPPDKIQRNEVAFNSKMIERLWGKGFVNIVKLEEGVAKYAAKYMNKLDPRWHDVPAFNTMSNRPGIGAGCVTPHLALTGVRYINGKSRPVPRYYMRLLQKSGFDTQHIQHTRAVLADQAWRDDLGQDAYDAMCRRFGTENAFTIHI